MPILIALLIILTASNTAADVRFITETENTADYEKFQKLNPKYTKDAATACFRQTLARMTEACLPTAARIPIVIRQPNAGQWEKRLANIPAAVSTNANKKRTATLAAVLFVSTILKTRILQYLSASEAAYGHV